MIKVTGGGKLSAVAQKQLVYSIDIKNFEWIFLLIFLFKTNNFILLNSKNIYILKNKIIHNFI